jgi:hypothetical protein
MSFEVQAFRVVALLAALLVDARLWFTHRGKQFDSRPNQGLKGLGARERKVIYEHTDVIPVTSRFPSLCFLWRASPVW